jgi:hypothetical protein
MKTQRASDQCVIRKQNHDSWDLQKLSYMLHRQGTHEEGGILSALVSLRGLWWK